MTEQTMPATRVARAIEHLNIKVGRGLEIGPLANPIVPKSEAVVYYVDVMPAETLRDHYAEDPAVRTERVVDLDFVRFKDGVTRSLADTAGSAAPFQWVVASHVIEHVPDFIGFLADVASILEDRGRLALVVPDRRYCFDALRPPTTVGEMLLAHDNGDTRPSVRAVFDHFASAVGFDPAQLWRGIPADPANRMYSLDTAWELVQRRRSTTEYLDTHTWLFTPTSFVEQLSILARLGLHDFTVIGISPTAVDDYEFFVTLERIPRDAAAEERNAAIASGFPPVAENPVPPPEQPASTPADQAGTSAVTMEVSRREQRLIEFKRRLLLPVHRIIRRIKR
jgi:hypothetical protein